MAINRGWIRHVRTWSFRIVALVLSLVVSGLAFLFSPALYRRWVVYPREQVEWARLRAERVAVSTDWPWRDFRGICHTHSEFSHDSQVPFEEILEAAHVADVDFLCMTDHCSKAQAPFGVQWSGIRDGVLFIPGFEMGYGFMPWGLPRETVLDCSEDPIALAARIEALGGMVFFAHSEMDRMWELPQLGGMEIYNIHTDFKDESLRELAPNMLLNYLAYPEQTFRGIFDRQDAILAKWDALNRDRDIVGIAGNDAHQNIGITIYQRDGGEVAVHSNSGDRIWQGQPTWWGGLLLWAFGEPAKPGGIRMRLEFDPYERSLQYVTTHVLAEELSQEAVLGALREGRAYIAFDMIADSRSFAFYARSPGALAAMGEAIPWSGNVRLHASAPIPSRFTLVRDGDIVARAEGRQASWVPEQPGKYRLEAELPIDGAWVPWVYTNPIAVAASR